MRRQGVVEEVMFRDVCIYVCVCVWDTILYGGWDTW